MWYTVFRKTEEVSNVKYYIKQKVFSWKDKFFIKDADGTDRYYAEGEVFTLGKKLHLYDMDGKEVAFIKQELWRFLPHYQIIIDGAEAAEVVKEFTFLKPKYTVNGPGWEIKGNFWAHEYEVTRNDYPVFSVRKEWMTWGDSYEIDIVKPEDAVTALAVTLIIDCVMASEAAAGAAAASN